MSQNAHLRIIRGGASFIVAALLTGIPAVVISPASLITSLLGLMVSLLMGATALLGKNRYFAVKQVGIMRSIYFQIGIALAAAIMLLITMQRVVIANLVEQLDAANGAGVDPGGLFGLMFVYSLCLLAFAFLTYASPRIKEYDLASQKVRVNIAFILLSLVFYMTVWGAQTFFQLFTSWDIAMIGGFIGLFNAGLWFLAWAVNHYFIRWAFRISRTPGSASAPSFADEPTASEEEQK